MGKNSIFAIHLQCPVTTQIDSDHQSREREPRGKTIHRER